MTEKIKSTEKDMMLDLEDLEKVSGGGLLAELKAMVERDGTGPELKRILLAEGKKAAVNRCNELYPGYASVAPKLVSAL